MRTRRGVDRGSAWAAMTGGGEATETPLESTYRSLCPAQPGMPEAECGPEGGGCTSEANRWRRLTGSQGRWHRLSVRPLHPCLPSFMASLCMQAHLSMHIHRLPGVAPSVSLTLSKFVSVGPGFTLSLNTDTLKSCTVRDPEIHTEKEVQK